MHIHSLLIGFSSSDADRCVYTKSVNDDHVIICLYMDDMLIFGTCNDIVFKNKSFLASKFEMKDIGETSVIWNITKLKYNFYSINTRVTKPRMASSKRNKITSDCINNWVIYNIFIGRNIIKKNLKNSRTKT